MMAESLSHRVIRRIDQAAEVYRRLTMQVVPPGAGKTAALQNMHERTAVPSVHVAHENLAQLNTYVSWYRKNMMTDGECSPVELLLYCQKDHALVEYAIAGIDNRLFVSRYQFKLTDKEAIQRYPKENIREAGDG